MTIPRKRTLLILLSLILALLLAACGPEPTPEPANTPTPAAVATEAPAQPTATAVPPTPTPIADDWERIQAAGKIAVGTSADYAPFSYYDENFKLTGFDIALIQEIGQRLGVEVQIRDYAFDGLAEALELGQIDLAIAAISVTPEREAEVDFSNVYYVGADAVLGRGDARPITAETLDNLSNIKVGVQSGSIYETWAQQELVETGRLPDRNLLVYAQIDQAVKDLKNKRLNAVILDKAPAEAFVKGGGVKIIGGGLSKQRFAMAVPLGSENLRSQVNGALAALQDEGFIAELSSQYLDLEETEIQPVPEETATPEAEAATPTPEPPTATPAPEATPAPTATPTPPPCLDGMAWVADLNYDDKGMTAPPVLQPGQAFTKGWRVRNSGTCTWTPGYFLSYSHGNSPASQMGGQPVAVAQPVAPNATYDFLVNLVAPTTPGVYQGFWQINNDKGVAFGERVWVGIQVPGAPTPTPFPTQTPSANIEFYADRTVINAGERVVFTWNVQNVKAVYFYEQGQPWQSNGVAGQGSREVYPQQTTVYELRVVKPDDSVEIRQIRIDVNAAPPTAPYIASFLVYPEYELPLGGCADIRWDVQGTVTTVNLWANDTPIWNNAPVRGSVPHCPGKAGYINYILEASGPGGTVREQRTINVLGPQPK